MICHRVWKTIKCQGKSGKSQGILKWMITGSPASTSFSNMHLKVLGDAQDNTVDSRYLELEGTRWNTSRYPYFDISDVQN